MQQAKNIATGIAEVDEFLQAHDDQAVLLEGHPEVCFRAFAEGPLEYNKNSAPGMAERLGALESATEYGTGEWRSLAENLAEQGHSVGTDDLIDALGLAYTAAAPDSHLHSLPSEPPTDATGLPMQMVYRRPNPFTV
jgi:predicted RNase H-like nuclease